MAWVTNSRAIRNARFARTNICQQQSLNHSGIFMLRLILNFPPLSHYENEKLPAQYANFILYMRNIRLSLY